MLRHNATDNSVTRLVISGVLLLFLGHDHGFALGAHHDLVFGQLKLFHFNNALAGTGSEQGSLVDQVSQVSTGEPRRTTGNHSRCHVVTHWHFAHVYFQDLFTATDIRQANHDLTVETARTQQCRVQHVRTVGRSDDDNAVIHFETIHLDQQLVEGLLTLIVTTTHAGATMATNGIDFIDKDDARSMFLGLFEHVANTTGTHADEHLDEVRAGNREERHLGLPGNRLGQQGFTGTRRTHHQHAARNTTTQALELARIAQKLYQFADFFLGFIATGNVSQGGLHLIFGEQARLALAEAHRPALASRPALHLAHEEHEHGDNHQDREAGYQELCPDTLLLRLLAFHDDLIIHQVADQPIVLNCRTNGLEAVAINALTGNHVAINRYALDLAILDLLDEVGIVEGLRLVRAGEVVHHRHQDSRDDQPQDQILCHIVQLTTL
ncbi:hypothetical protein PFLU3_21630 [Pseudomonas fluorescens]|uniref:Uncharacterized protein n=1 Tax=Pseudomonas fluorescens TaxID=294 RepID=A0A0D0SJU1_PSEFL|nr:hypothetical protein PFLU3_21630 [Pseudomonas fluorescens]